jgi:hypothetical protein
MGNVHGRDQFFSKQIIKLIYQFIHRRNPINSQTKQQSQLEVISANQINGGFSGFYPAHRLKNKFGKSISAYPEKCTFIDFFTLGLKKKINVCQLAFNQPFGDGIPGLNFFLTPIGILPAFQ